MKTPKLVYIYNGHVFLLKLPQPLGHKSKLRVSKPTALNQGLPKELDIGRVLRVLGRLCVSPNTGWPLAQASGASGVSSLAALRISCKLDGKPALPKLTWMPHTHIALLLIQSLGQAHSL